MSSHICILGKQNVDRLALEEYRLVTIISDNLKNKQPKKLNLTFSPPHLKSASLRVERNETRLFSSVCIAHVTCN